MDMKISTMIFILTILCLSVSSQEWGLERFAQSNINIRAERNTNSKIVGKLVQGEKIKVDFLQNNWYAVFKLNENRRSENASLGYVYAPLLVPDKPSNISSAQSTSYKIVEKKDISYLNNSRMVYRVVLDVNKLPSKEEVKRISVSIWSNGNKGWDEFTVFTYLPGMNTQSTAYGAAEFSRSGLKEFSIYDYSLYGTKWKK